MDRLCFGTYAKILKETIQESNDNQSVADLLLGFIIDQAQIFDKNEELISLTPKVVSQLFNFKQNIPKSIKSATSSSKVTNI